MTYPAGPGGQALRRGRYSEASRAYLLTAVTDCWIPWFQSSQLARIMSRSLHDMGKRSSARVLCWVVMPDHIHLLLELGNSGLPQVMRGVKGRSAVVINRALHRRGRFWAPGYHDRTIRNSEKLLEVARYVIANPLRANLVDDVGQYPYWDAAWLCGPDLL